MAHWWQACHAPSNVASVAEGRTGSHSACHWPVAALSVCGHVSLVGQCGPRTVACVAAVAAVLNQRAGRGTVPGIDKAR